MASLRDAFARPEPALNLAVFRVTVPAIILVSPELSDGVRWSALPAALRVPPEGLGWFAAHVPISPGIATAAQVVAVACALAAIAGVYARAALALLTVSGFYLFAIPQLVGTVVHDMHLLWFAALLAASPCADALAFDARGRPPAAPSFAYGAPLLVARALLGAIYFFPGFWKLAESGLAWATSDNLRNQMHWKWFQIGGWVPPVRVDNAAVVLHVGALLVIAFELGFVALVMWRRTRWLAIAGGVAFHVTADWLLKIPFFSLWGCYTSLVDWDAALRRFRRAPAPEPVAIAGRAWPSIVLGAALLAGAVVQGARGKMNAFPFACYPTFQWMVGSEMPDLVIEVVDDEGIATEITHARGQDGKRTQRSWGIVWSLAGVTEPASEARLRAYWRELSAAGRFDGARRVRFSRAYYAVAPEERGSPPLRKELLLELAVTPAT